MCGLFALVVFAVMVAIVVIAFRMLGWLGCRRVGDGGRSREKCHGKGEDGCLDHAWFPERPAGSAD